MTVTDLMLIFVIVAITGVTFALLGIRKAIEELAAEIRKQGTTGKGGSDTPEEGSE